MSTHLPDRGELPALISTPTPEGYRVVGKEQVTGLLMAALVSDAAPEWGMKNAKAWQTEFNEPDQFVLGLVDENGNLAAAGTMYVHSGHRRATLEHLVVGRAHRRRGLGTYCLKERVRRADDMGVETLMTAFTETNMMIAVYKELGFRINARQHTGIRRRSVLEQVERVDVERPAGR